MLAADAEFQTFACLPPSFRRNRDELAHALLIERDERIGRDHFLFEILVDEARRVIAADAEGRLREIVGAEGEKLR